MFINGEVINEKYNFFTEIQDESNSTFLLEKDEYFILGDNRSVSNDSRSFGPISKAQIIGKVVIRIYPFNMIETYFS